MVYKDRFHHADDLFKPKSESFIDCILTVEYFSSGTAPKMIVVKRSSVTALLTQVVELVTKLKCFREKHVKVNIRPHCTAN